ncbi:MAG: hypothetical protein ACRDT0_11300 [Pseudonocardiaceae bacterium]
MTTPQPQAPAPHPSAAETPRKTDLSVTQVSASALAAITAAVLGSQIGVFGTIGGAAAASVITTVGTSIYKHSLERSRERVRRLAVRTKQFPAQRAADDTPPTHRHGDPLGQALSDAPTERVVTPPTERVVTPATAPATPPLTARQRKLRWAAAVAGSLAAFVVAMMLITGFEFATGRTLGGHGDGVTVGRLADSRPAPEQPSEPAPAAPAPLTTSEDATQRTSTDTTTAPRTTTTPNQPEQSRNLVPLPTGKPTVVPTGGLPLPR